MPPWRRGPGYQPPDDPCGCGDPRRETAEKEPPPEGSGPGHLTSHAMTERSTSNG